MFGNICLTGMSKRSAMTCGYGRSSPSLPAEFHACSSQNPLRFEAASSAFIGGVGIVASPGLSVVPPLNS